MDTKHYHVFISHNSKDKPAVEEIVNRLIDEAQLEVWFDKGDMRAGEDFESQTTDALNECQACAIFVSDKGWGHNHLKEAQIALDKAGITVNKNMIPDDPRKPMDPSGIRLGTPALTTRGMKETEMGRIADWIDLAIASKNDDAKLAAIREEIRALTKQFPLYPELDEEVK